MQIIKLSNGKRVANFSSPHPFTFTDGTVLPAISNEESERLKVDFHETLENDRGDVSLSFTISNDVREEMRKWEWEWQQGNVDVVFCALPMLVALSSHIDDPSQGYVYDILYSPFRAIRMEDRIKKLVSIDKQCLAKGQC